MLILELRWVLIAFKREFPFDDVLRLWEVLWTNYYTKHFVLFVVLAVLESHRDVIIRYLIEVGYSIMGGKLGLILRAFHSLTKSSR